MKGQTVGNVGVILWPSDEDMLALHEISCRDYITSEVSALDLLWPASLINEQARQHARRDWSRPLAVLSFLASAVMAVAIGPMQMILVAAVLDYNWVTSNYFPTALNVAFVATGVVAILNLVALVLAWRARPQQTYLTMTLVAGSSVEVALIWLAGNVVDWQPHMLTLILLIAFAVSLIGALIVSKGYTSRTHHNTITKVGLTLLIVAALAELALSTLHVFGSDKVNDPERLRQLAVAQEQAHRAEVTRGLSDLAYILCGEPYQIVYASQETASGLFQCKESTEVYSVTDLLSRDKTVKGAAMYLGVTKNSGVGIYFPNARYLYRALPSASEDELALMVGAATEQELVDNITQPLLEYWQKHSERDLFVNIFYNSDLNAVSDTRDFVLMSALDTMAMSADLPRGNAYEGYWDGKILPYIYEADLKLAALNELGSDPKLYADSSRIALLTHRHLSLRLTAGEGFSYETLREKLQDSFVGGIEPPDNL